MRTRSKTSKRRLVLESLEDRFTPAGMFPLSINDAVQTETGLINNDAYVDIVALTSDGTIFVFLGSSTGDYSSPVTTATSASTTGFAIGDFDGDDVQDILLADGTATVATRSGNGDGTFDTAVTTSFSLNIAKVQKANFNSDAYDDFVGYGFGAILVGNGDSSTPGTFTNSHGFVGASSFPNVAVLDVDGDTDDDLAITALSTNFYGILRNNGGGGSNFSSQIYSTTETPTNLAVGQFDGVGGDDVVVSFAGKSPDLISFNGTYTQDTSSLASLPSADQVLALTLNDDGITDLAFFNQAGSTLAIYDSSGAGNYSSHTATPVTVAANFVRAADLNGDGYSNIFAADATSLFAVNFNVPPVLGGVVASQAVNDNATIGPFSSFTISDIDFPTQTLTVSVQLSSTANGAFTSASLLASGFTDQTGGLYEFTGTASQAQAAIRQLIFVPVENQVTPGNTVTTTFTVTADDGIATAASDNTTSVVVTSVNDAPVLGGAIASQAVNDNATISPFTAFTISDIDNPAQTLTVDVQLNNAANGTFTATSLTTSGFSAQGSGIYRFSGTAAAAQVAIRALVFAPTTNHVAVGNTVTTTFTVSAADGVAPATTNNTTKIIATSINDAPVLGSIGNKSIAEKSRLAFTVAASDVDKSSSLQFSLVGAPTGATITSNGRFLWTPTEAQGPGSYTFDIVVSDGEATDRETIVVSVTEVTSPPVLNAISDVSAKVGSVVRLQAVAHDADLPANTLTYSLDAASSARGMLINSRTGAFQWKVPADQRVGNYAVTISVDDGTGQSDSTTFRISVQDLPTIDLVNGTLRITGTNKADNILVNKVAANYQVVATIGTFHYRMFATSAVQRILINAGAGDDVVTIASSVALPAIINGGGGDDILSGGSGNDELLGGNGDDQLIGNSGDDLLVGGNGNDLILGGSGNDVLVGNAGRDQLFGDLGNDLLIGGAADDTLNDSSGRDYLLGSGTTNETRISALIAAWTEWQASRRAAALRNLGKVSPDNIQDTFSGKLVGDVVRE